jgi:hypothetical protein
MDRLGSRMVKLLFVYCAAALGPAFRGIAVLRIATATSPTFGTSISVFGWFASFPGLCSPLLSCPFALYTS